MIDEIFSEIINFHLEQKKKFSLYDNNTQQFFIIGAITLFITSIITKIVSVYLIPNDTLKQLLILFSLLQLIFAESLIALNQITFVFSDSIKVIKNPMLVFLSESKDNCSKLNKLALKLSQYPKSDLELVASLIETESKHLKSRIGLLVGALETVGFIPIIITTAISAYALIVDKHVNFPYMNSIAYGLLALYIIMIPIFLFSHQLDKKYLAIKHGLAIQVNKKLVSDGFQPPHN